MDHLAVGTNAVTLLEVMAEDGSAEANPLVVDFDFLDVFKLAVGTADALVT